MRHTVPPLVTLLMLMAWFALPAASRAQSDCNGNGVEDALEIRRTEWSAPVAIADVEGINALIAGDLDGDSSMDVVALTFTHIEIIWSAAGASRRDRDSFEFGYLNYIPALADVDVDGDLDLIVDSASTTASGVWIIENLGGRSFRFPDAPTLVSYGFVISTGDLNGDTLPDLISTVPRIGVHLNDGAGNYVSSEPIPDSERVEGFAASDIDGDGDLDLILTLRDAAVVLVYENDGSGHFTLAQSIPLSAAAGALAVADLDGDARRDVIVASGEELVLAAQRDDGGFDVAKLPGIAAATSIILTDTNGDAAPEMVLGTRRRRFELYVNEDGAFRAAGQSPRIYESLSAVDLNGDGLGDILGLDGNRVVYVRGDGAEGLLFPRLYSSLGRAFQLAKADLDDDGDVDFIVRNLETRGPSLLTAMTNDGTGALSVAYARVFEPCGFGAADVDGQGPAEIVVSREGGTDILGATDERLQYEIRSTFPSPRPCGRVEIADLDLDLDLDLVVGQGLEFFENIGGELARVNLAFPAGFHRPRIADFDGVGGPDMVDLALTPQFEDILTFYRNVGGFEFAHAGERRLSLAATDIALADLDGDEAVEFLSTDDRVLQVERNRGNGRFDAAQSYEVSFANQIRPGDIDGDGDVDIVGVGGRSIALINLGNGRLVETEIPLDGGVHDAAIADVDGDGLNDLVFAVDIAFPPGPRVAVLKNRLVSGDEPDCDASMVLDACELDGMDCNADGSPDVCDPDSDFDGRIDGCDECPGFDNRLDADGDGAADCVDVCARDTAKFIGPGACGCNSPETDLDGDSVPNCVDNCRTQANTDQADRDADRVGDACDECPDDGVKGRPGECGCGVIEFDRDADGAPDCVDACPLDSSVSEPGPCACRVNPRDPVPDRRDPDGDELATCVDNCPRDANQSQEDSDGDGFGDACDSYPGAGCHGDCDRDGRLRVDELRTIIATLFVGGGEPSGCASDTDGDGTLRANDVVAVVRAAWQCSSAVTPTPTATPSPTPTPVFGKTQIATAGGFDLCSLSGGGHLLATIGFPSVNPEIELQRFDASWNRVGSPTRIPAKGFGVRIGCDSTGRGIVLWIEDTVDSDVKGRLIGADGEPRGSEFYVHDGLTGEQSRPAAACNESGRCMVTWNGDFRLNPPARMRTFDVDIGTDGSALGLPSQRGNGGPTDVVALADGDFVAATDTSIVNLLASGLPERASQSLDTSFFYDAVALAGTGNGGIVLAANASGELRWWRYNSAGGAIVAAATVGDSRLTGEPDVDLDASGRVVIAAARRQEERRELVVQRFGPDGSPASDLLLVGPSAAFQSFDPIEPKVTADDEGGFSVLWRENVSIVLRRFDADNSPLPGPGE